MKKHLGSILVAIVIVFSGYRVHAQCTANWATSGTSLYHDACSKVGVGNVPTEKFHVFEDANLITVIAVQNPNVGTGAAAILRADSWDDNAYSGATVNFQAHGRSRTLPRFGVALGGWAEFINWRGNGLIVGTTHGVPLILGTNNVDRIHILPNGNVGIGATNPQYKLEVVGNANFQGTVTGTNIQAHYQDLAEWVPVTEELPPGTVVVVDVRSRNTVTPSSQAYDTRVAGIVSAQPGVILGTAAPSKEMIATTGRVKVRVDASGAPIHTGDLLVTSDRPGVAMRSEGLDLGGVKIHRPGTLIGKALEPLDKGEGEILVLLSLQ